MGVNKGLGMHRLLGLMAEMEGRERATFDFVLCIGEMLLVGGRGDLR